MTPTSLELLPRVVLTRQHLLLVIALCYVELLFHCTKPIIYFQGISGMRKHRGAALQEFTTLVMWCSTNQLILLILHQSLHKLCVHYQKLLNSRWWWWWWMWGNTSTTSASSSSRHLLIKYSKFRNPQVRIHSENFLDDSQQQQLCKTVISRVTEIQIECTLYGWKAYEIFYNFYSDHFPRFCR